MRVLVSYRLIIKDNGKVDTEDCEGQYGRMFRLFSCNGLGRGLGGGKDQH